jgi:hypothetical protein
MARIMLVLVAIGGAGAAALATPPSDIAPTPQVVEPQICKSVVSAERGAKPYKLCMTRAEWEAKKIADAKDANRIVCHYDEQLGTRLRVSKVCMPASEWDAQRRADREAVERAQMQACVPGAGC